MTAAAPRPLDVAAVRYGPDGLVPAIVQDADDGRVLMLAWQDAEALAATLRSGEVHFHSRSRDALWRKGETSGNTLAVTAIELDCDADAVLIRARAAGPTCHTGARSCFDVGESLPGLGATAGPEAGLDQAGLDEPARAEAAAEAGPTSPGEPGQAQGFDWLEQLWATIAERARTRPEGSWTSRLLDGGVDAVARKVAEEATEVVLAAKDDAVAEEAGRERADRALAGELADLLYHALVLCAERDLPPARVIAELRSRHRA